MNKNVLTARMLSSNPVQQENITNLLDLIMPNFDDIYDVANHIAAMQKVTEHLSNIVWATNVNPVPWAKDELIVYIAHAMTDWKFKADPFNKNTKAI